MSSGTFYLHFLGLAVIQHFIVVVSLGLGHKVNVFYVPAFFEHYGPVGIVVPHWGVDIESSRQLGVYSHLVLCFQLFGKVHLYAFRVNHYNVIQ